MLVIEKVANTLKENSFGGDVNAKNPLGFAQSPTWNAKLTR
jgi:hypothetical protein